MKTSRVLALLLITVGFCFAQAPLPCEHNPAYMCPPSDPDYPGNRTNRHPSDCHTECKTTCSVDFQGEQHCTSECQQVCTPQFND